MARFNQPRFDYRGTEYDRRFGRYEQAFARKAAMDAHYGSDYGPWGPPPYTERGPVRWTYDEQYMHIDRAYSRRNPPPALRRRYRNF